MHIWYLPVVYFTSVFFFLPDIRYRANLLLPQRFRATGKQMAQATSKACSVPGCCCYSQKQPYLSFHSFPVHGEVRRRWIQAIRREEGPDFTIQTGTTYVCSRHFTLDDYVLEMSSPFSITIRRLKANAVPSLFSWNDFTPGGKMDRVERSQKRPPVLSVGAQIKDITRPPVPSVGAEIKDITRPPVPSVGEQIKDITRPPVPSVGAEIKDITRPPVLSVGAQIKDITRPPVPSVGAEIKDITRPPVPSVGAEIKDVTRPPVPSVGAEIKDVTRPPVSSVGAEIKDVTRPPVPSVGAEIKDVTRPPVPSVGAEIKDVTRPPVLSVGAQIKKALYDALKQEHDYATPPPAGMLDGTVDYIQYLEAELKNALPPSPSSSDLFSRYCASDDQMRFYTRFPSERVFRIFWESIAPSASQLLYWNKAQRISEGSSDPASPSPPSTLPLIDEFLIYCMQVAVGVKEQVIADMFRIRLTAVSRVTITWANYLFFVLGTLPLWPSREKVKAAMPGIFKKCCPDVRVVLECAEIPAAAAAAAAAASSSSGSRVSSRCRNGMTFKPYFKGLIGVAPHGLVTFFSPLYAGSLSDEDITKVSGVLPLLEPGDEVVAGEGFGIGELLSGVGAKLVTRLTREDAEKTRAVERLGTAVGRVIGRIKSNHIWDSPVPPALMGSVSQIWHNCCVMVNFQGPLSLDEDCDLERMLA
ncbi:uncharacterized protein LOC114549098 [Perca flavescens]|uniref:uncharacterized protein LOC114549098 n=1 Tax=Perca flavescens TaxID=8167 RepID=UPI00106DE219|nr:uncharacterized protein LOC114549098 [Perca flavescens]